MFLILLRPLRVLDVVLDVVDIGLMLLFEAKLQTKITFFLKKTHTD